MYFVDAVVLYLCNTKKFSVWGPYKRVFFDFIVFDLVFECFLDREKWYAIVSVIRKQQLIQKKIENNCCMNITILHI